MMVTKDELRGMDSSNTTWKDDRGYHPVWSISDDLFDRILDDLHRLAAIEDGQGKLL